MVMRAKMHRKSDDCQISIWGEYLMDRVNAVHECIILGQVGTLQKIRDFWYFESNGGYLSEYTLYL